MDGCCIFPPPFTTKNYQVLCVSKLDGVMFVDHWFPENEGCAALADKFASDSEENDYFINKVIDNYLVTAIHNFKISQGKKLKALILSAKEEWMITSNERRQAELYLGRLPFHEELKRSCGEFYSTLKSTCGFCPTKHN
jgi:hypothetical protein